MMGVYLTYTFHTFREWQVLERRENCVNRWRVTWMEAQGGIRGWGRGGKASEEVTVASEVGMMRRCQPCQGLGT